MLIFLVIVTPFSFAVELISNVKTDISETPLPQDEQFDERFTGESIVINVKSYEPVVLKSSLIEENDVNVYAYLIGTTPGTLLGIKGQEPFFSEPDVAIKNIEIRPDQFSTKYVRRTAYIRPKKYSFDNFGTILIGLKKIEKEKDVPEVISLNMTARVYFQGQRIFGVGEQDLVLDQQKDEKLWKNIDLSNYAFWSSRGYLRASSVSNNKATINVYDGSLRSLGSITLNKGDTSGNFRLVGSTDLFENNFRVKLVDTVDPSRKQAKIRITKEGQQMERLITEGAPIYPLSKWKVDSILKYFDKDSNKIVEKVILHGPEGTKDVTRSYGGAESNLNDISLTQNAALKFERTTTIGGKIQVKLNDFINAINEQIVKKNILSASTPTFTIPQPVTLPFVDAVFITKPLYSFNQGMSLGRILDDILVPLGYDWTVEKGLFKVKTRGAILDPCDKISAIDLEKLDSASKEQLYCNAVKEFRTLLNLGGVEDENKISYSDKANYWIGRSYEKLAELYPKINKIEESEFAKQKAVDSYSAVKRYNKEDTLARLNNLNNKKNIASKENSFEENDIDVGVELLEVVDTSRLTLPSAHIEVNSAGKNYKLGEVLPNNWRLKEVNDNSVVIESTEKASSAVILLNQNTDTYTIGSQLFGDWIIKEIQSNKVIINKPGSADEILELNKIKTVDKQDLRVSQITFKADRTQELTLKKNYNIDGNNLRVVTLETQKVAYVTILPGSGRDLISESHFLLHIPIEKRLIKLNPDKIDDKIESTQKKIEKLDKVIKDLSKVVENWKKVCLIGFAWFTLKNSFFSGLSRTQARQTVVRGIDGKSGISAWCQNQVANGFHKNFDNCMTYNADKISGAIDDYQTAIEKTNEDMKDYQNKAWYKDKLSKLKDFDAYGKNLDIKEIINPEELRNNRLRDYMKNSKAYTDPSFKGDNKLSYNFASDLGDLNKDLFIDARKVNAYNAVVDKIKAIDFGRKDAEEQKRLFSTLYHAELNKDEFNKVKADVRIPDFDAVKDYLRVSSDVFLNDKDANKLKTYVNDDKPPERDLAVLNVGNYKEWLENNQKKCKVSTTDLTKDFCNRVEKDLNKISIDKKYKDQPTKQIITQDEQNLYYDALNKDIYIASSITYLTPNIYCKKRNTYANNPATIEFYKENKVKYLPLGNGGYLEVESYTQDGKPDRMYVWNVGQDGKIGTSDDCMERHYSDLTRDRGSLAKYTSAVIKFNGDKNPSGKVIYEVGGQKFVKSYNIANNLENVKKPTCYDIMEPTDCRLLFGMCDPVMCPTSRCNLGGRWNVDNVVATGIIGSTILCAPNFDLPYEPVPICLTGINAGLQNIRSILQGYVSCLKTAKVKGQSVGICDKIRSVFTCELLWREAIAIFNVHGGIVNLISEKVFGQKEGGGEYLTFKGSLQNVENSVKFFTQDYANTAFAAYNARSLDEVGAEICKSAIYGKVPGIGNFMEQIAKPESPPQFTALLTETPYAESQGLSAYQIFYHIYAGESLPENQYLQYSVFLRSAANEVYYATERCNGVVARIKRSDIASQTIDCVAPKGFNELCVKINGVTKCGFGKVTTDFSLNYVNDLIVADEARRNINSERQCVPDDPRLSPSLGSLPLPGKIDILNTGIQRVCSLNNPGAATNPNDWRQVGTCGDDKVGRFIGYCWMDMRTVSIKDLETRNEIQGELTERGLNLTKTKEGIKGLLGKEESKSQLNLLNSQLDNNGRFTEDNGFELGECSSYKSLIVQHKELSRLSTSFDTISEAQYKTGLLYYGYANKGCGRREATVAVCPDIDKEDKCPDSCDSSCLCMSSGKNIDPGEICKKIVTSILGIVPEEKDSTKIPEKTEATETTSKTSLLEPESIGSASGSERKEQKSTSPTKVQETPQLNVDCQSCGTPDSPFKPFICNENKCHTVGNTCFYLARLLGFRGYCTSCNTAQSCEDFNYDEQRCISSICNKQASLKCAWDNSRNLCYNVK